MEKIPSSTRFASKPQRRESAPTPLTTTKSSAYEDDGRIAPFYKNRNHKKPESHSHSRRRQPHDYSCPDDEENVEESPVTARQNRTRNAVENKIKDDDDGDDNDNSGKLNKDFRKPEKEKRVSIQSRYIEWYEQKYPRKVEMDKDDDNLTPKFSDEDDDDGVNNEEIDDNDEIFSGRSSKSRCTTPIKGQNSSPATTGTSAPSRVRGSSSRDEIPSKTTNLNREIDMAQEMPRKSHRNVHRRNSKIDDDDDEPEINESQSKCSAGNEPETKDSQRKHSVGTAKRSAWKNPGSNRPARSNSVGPDLKQPAPNRSVKTTDSSMNSSRRDSGTRAPADRRESTSLRKNSAANNNNSNRRNEVGGKDFSRKNSKVGDETRPSNRQSHGRNSEKQAAISEGNGDGTARETETQVQYQAEEVENLREERDRAKAERGKLEQQVLNLVERSFQREKEFQNICFDRDKRLEEMNSLKDELESWKNKCANLEENSRNLQEMSVEKTMGVEAIVGENSKWTKLLQSKQIELNTLKAGQKMISSSLIATKSRVFDLRKRLKSNSEKFRRLNSYKEKESEAECNPDVEEGKNEDLDGEHTEIQGQDDPVLEDVQALAMDLEAEVLELIEEARAREQNMEKEKSEIYRQHENLRNENERIQAKMEAARISTEEARANVQQMEEVIADKSNKIEELTAKLEFEHSRIKRLRDDIGNLTDELQKERKEKQKVTNMYFTAVNEFNGNQCKKREEQDVLVKKSHDTRKDKKEKESKRIGEADAVSEILREYESEIAKKDEEIGTLTDQMAGLEKDLQEVRARAKLSAAGFMRETSCNNEQRRPRRPDLDHEGSESETLNILHNADPRKEALIANLRKRIHEAAALITDSYSSRDKNSHSKNNGGLSTRLDERKFTERHQWEEEIRRLLDGKDSRTADTSRALSGVVQELESSL